MTWGATPYADSDGNAEDNPRHYRKAEKRLKTLQQWVSRKKARKALAKQHLKIQRRREEHAKRLARALVMSTDLIACEDLQIKNMVKNHHLAKSISDAGWGIFLGWVKYYAKLHGIEIVAVPPAYTSQKCSGCHHIVKKSLSVRTHICYHCGLILDRDINAALNILRDALRILGHRKTATS